MKIKNVLFLLLAFVIFSSSVYAYSFVGAESSILSQLEGQDGSVRSMSTVNVKINGVSPYFQFAPILTEYSTLVPVRAVMEYLNFTVGWDDPTQTVTISGINSVTGTNTTVTLVINSSEITVNGIKKEIPSPAQLIGDTTYVPIRAVSEALGATVGWDAATNSAGIYTYNKSHTMSIGDYKVTIGQTTDELFSICGAPSYSLIGENGLMWHVYAVYAPAFMMVASDAGIVCGYYTNSTLFTTSEGLSYGSAAVSETDQYEYVKIDNINIHKYYDTFEGILCGVYAIADGYINNFDISLSLSNQSRMGIDILNSFRYANHLSPLVWDDAAAACSADHARYMSSQGELTHTGPEGTSAIQRYLTYNPGFKWTSWGENICAGAKNIFMCMNGWRNSMQHRYIMLSDKTSVGIGMIYQPGAAYEYCAAMLLLK